MFETLFFTLLSFLFLIRTKRRTKQPTKQPSKPHSLDAELKELIESSNYATGIGLEIKNFLLDLIADERNGSEKFSDARLAQAQRIIDRAGPGALYWMGDIATQFAFLAAAQINGVATNVSSELTDIALPEDIVRIVVRP